MIEPELIARVIENERRRTGFDSESIRIRHEMWLAKKKRIAYKNKQAAAKRKRLEHAQGKKAGL